MVKKFPADFCPKAFISNHFVAISTTKREFFNVLFFEKVQEKLLNANTLLLLYYIFMKIGIKNDENIIQIN